MASSSAVAESNSNGGDDLLTGDLGKNDYDWLLTPPGSPPAQIYHYNSSENGENFLSDPTALPNLVRSLATIKTSRQQVVGSKPDLITSKIKDPTLFSQRNNGWNTAARSISNGANFSTISSRKPSPSSSSSASASASGSRPSSRSSTPIKRNPNPNTVILPSRPTTPTSRSSSKQPPSATIISSRSTTPTIRTRTTESSLVRTTNGNSSSMSGSFSMTTTSSRSSTPSKRPSTPQSTGQMIRSSSVSKGRPLPSRSTPSSRSTSPNGKVPAQTSTATWQQLSAIPGFALEPPPNLRTTAAARPSSNMRSSYSSPMENHPIHIAATSSVSDGHDHHHITPRRASDGHDMMARRSTDGHDLISRRTSDGHDLTSQRTSDGHDLASRRPSDGPDPISRRASASPARIRSTSTIPPGSTFLDRSSSGSSASLFSSRASSLKIERNPNATSKAVDKMIQSRRPISSNSSFNFPETMPRAGSMSQMKSSSGGGKPASPTASSRDAGGFTRSSPRKPVDFAWNKDIRQSASNGLHSLVSNVPASSLYSIRPHYPGTRAVASQSNYVTSTKLDSPTTHDTSLEQYGMINSKNIAHDLELSSDLGEEFIMGEFGSISSKLSASPASQGDSFSSLVKDSRVNNWLGSPERYRDEIPEANIEKPVHNKVEMAAHNEPEMVTDAIESPPIVCRHGSVASSCDLCMVKLRLQRLNEKCKASLAASFQASNDYSWKSSLSNGTLSARQN